MSTTKAQGSSFSHEGNDDNDNNDDGAPLVLNGGTGRSRREGYGWSDSDLTPLVRPKGKQSSSSDVRLWARICLVVAAAALSSSVITAFPTVEPILIDRRPAYGAGMFESICPPCYFGSANRNSSLGGCAADRCASHTSLFTAEAACLRDKTCSGVVAQLLTANTTWVFSCRSGQLTNATANCTNCNAWIVSNPTECGHPNATATTTAADLADALDACNSQISHSSTLFSISIGLSMCTSLLSGFVFDKFGPRSVAVAGAAVVAVCFGLITVRACPSSTTFDCHQRHALSSVSRSTAQQDELYSDAASGIYACTHTVYTHAVHSLAFSQRTCRVVCQVALTAREAEWLVWFAAPLADVAGNLVSYTIYGFIWHAPEHQALIAALYTASVGLSSALASVAVWLVRECGVPPTLVWLVFSGFAVVSAAICSISGVTRDEYHQRATQVTGEPSAPTKASLWKQVREVTRWWRSTNTTMSAMFLLFAIFTYAALGVWVSERPLPEHCAARCAVLFF